MILHTIVLPFQVHSQNDRERWHWRQQRAEVSTAFLMCRVHAAGVPKARVHRTVVITSYRKRLFTDHANLVGGCKGLVDGMVRAELLVDDAIAWASFTYAQAVMSKMPPLPRSACGGRPCTMIQIHNTPAAPAAQLP